MATYWQVLPDVYEIGVRFVSVPWMTRAYLVTRTDPRGLLLVDAGSRGSDQRVLACIRDAGYAPADLQVIVLTHWHEDHSGALGTLLDQAPQAQVYAGPADAAILREQKPRLIHEAGILGKSAGGQINHAPGKLTPAQGARIHDLTPENADTLLAGWDLRVLNVPGHTAGSIALYSPGRRALFAGDALGGRGRVLFTFMTYDDQDQMDATARQLMDADFKMLLPGHAHALRDVGKGRRRPIGRLSWFERVVMERVLGLTLLARV